MTACSRRDFSARLAASVTATLTAKAALAADPPEKPAETERPQTQPSLSADDHLLAVLLDRYPAAHLTPEMLAGVRAGLQSNRRVADRLRETQLPHEVEPAFLFRVWRGV